MNWRCFQKLWRSAFIATAIALFGVNALGAPVTLHFDTTVANISGLPLGAIETSQLLPFAVSPGDPLSVTFTYDPWPGPGSYVQSGSLQMTIGSQLLTAPFQIAVRDDVVGLIDTPGRIVGTAPNVDITSFLADQVNVTCPGGLGTYCGTVAGHDEFKFTSQLVFEDRDLQTLSSAGPPDAASFWDSFASREMRIGFNNGAFIGAYIPGVMIVPEPMALPGFLFLGGIGFARLRRYRYGS